MPISGIWFYVFVQAFKNEAYTVSKLNETDARHIIFAHYYIPRKYINFYA